MAADDFNFVAGDICHNCRSHDKHKFFDCMQGEKSTGKICIDCRITSSIDGRPTCPRHIEEKCGSKRHAKCLMAVFLDIDKKTFKKVAIMPEETKAILLQDLVQKEFIVYKQGFFFDSHKITDLGVSALRDLTVAFQNQWDFAYFLKALDGVKPEWKEILGLVEKVEIRAVL